MSLAVGEVVVDGWVLGLELELAGDGDGSRLVVGGGQRW